MITESEKITVLNRTMEIIIYCLWTTERKRLGTPNLDENWLKYYEMVPRLKELSQRDSGLRTFWHSKRSPVTKVALSLHLFLQDHTIMQGFVFYDTFGNI